MQPLLELEFAKIVFQVKIEFNKLEFQPDSYHLIENFTSDDLCEKLFTWSSSLLNSIFIWNSSLANSKFQKGLHNKITSDKYFSLIFFTKTKGKKEEESHSYAFRFCPSVEPKICVWKS